MSLGFKRTVHPATIPALGTLSNVIDLQEGWPIGLELPIGFGIAGSLISFLGTSGTSDSNKPGTLAAVHDSLQTEVLVKVPTLPAYVIFNPILNLMAGNLFPRYIQVRLGTSGSPLITAVQLDFKVISAAEG